MGNKTEYHFIYHHHHAHQTSTTHTSIANKWKPGALNQNYDWLHNMHIMVKQQNPFPYKNSPFFWVCLSEKRCSDMFCFVYQNVVLYSEIILFYQSYIRKWITWDDGYKFYQAISLFYCFGLFEPLFICVFSNKFKKGKCRLK